MRTNGSNPKFENTPEGRKAAEDYSRQIGTGGFWEPYVQDSDDSNNTNDTEFTERTAVMAVFKAIKENPSSFSSEQVQKVSDMLRKLLIDNMAPTADSVDLTDVEMPPMQPGEPSWASFKDGGGPHTTEFGPSPAKQNPHKDNIGEPSSEVVQITELSDAMPTKHVVVERQVPNDKWSGMMA